MSNIKSIQKQIIGEIEKAQHIMLVSHQRPDGDTAGAALAMAHYLEGLGKDFTCFCCGELSATLKFLPKAGNYKCDHSVLSQTKFDLLIVLDSGDLKYAGIEDHIKELSHEFKIINIDHHPTNDHYGDYNLVIHEASSTCEIIHDLLDGVDALNKNIATCLLTGIVTDTNGFSNLATSAASIEAAGKLLLHGANLKQITQFTLEHRPIDTLRLWGRALERLNKDEATGTVSTFITYDDIKECDAGAEALEGVANFLNSLDEAKHNMVMVLTERERGVIKASVRTTSPLLDVSKFAKMMGGGGHKKAAGFSIKGSLIKTDYGYRIEKSN